MPLKTLVKVGNITNLSDARYCAGMGVDMLGFGVIPDQPNHITETLFQQIRGWVSGPKVVAEIYGISNVLDLNGLVQSYAPDYIECDFETYHKMRTDTKLPFIVYLSSKDLIHVTENHPNVAYWLTSHDESIITNQIPVLVKITSKEDLTIVEDYAGVALSGSAEIRPGFKDYEDLAEILEELDVE
jgi:phosphoribosylanthranilate isomerase